MEADYEDDGWSEEERPALNSPEEAKGLVEEVTAILVAGANRSMAGPPPDRADYRNKRKALAHVLTQFGIRNPFPWRTLDIAVEAAKNAHSGTGSHALRRRYFQEYAAKAIGPLELRIADRDSGDISAAIEGLRSAVEATVLDASSLRLELRRIEAALPGDPGAAISRAKNLIEAVAKRVIIDSGGTVNTDRAISALTTQATEVLGIDRKSAAGYHKDFAILMEKLHGCVIAIGDIRNAVGDGHGAAELPEDLAPSHGRLAARGAIAWCGFMLDTLHARQQRS
ncbi:abortive infection family protein [Lentzea sp. NPDC003310]|uniref:abortive infection family protein n=1 Tax=Lentzea sp. NPDC003310 TaxID=3154447 RepID=UPI0033B643E4